MEYDYYENAKNNSNTRNIWKTYLKRSQQERNKHERKQ